MPLVKSAGEIRADMAAGQPVPGQTRDRVLTAIRDLSAALGRTPTRRELGERLGVAGSTVDYHVDRLAEAGLIQVTRGGFPRYARRTRARTITILSDGPAKRRMS